MYFYSFYFIIALSALVAKTVQDYSLTQLQLINKVLKSFKGSNFFHMTRQVIPIFTNVIELNEC